MSQRKPSKVFLKGVQKSRCRKLRAEVQQLRKQILDDEEQLLCYIGYASIGKCQTLMTEMRGLQTEQSELQKGLVVVLKRWDSKIKHGLRDGWSAVKRTWRACFILNAGSKQ